MARWVFVSMVLTVGCGGPAGQLSRPEAAATLQQGDPVKFEALQTFLPVVPGWARGSMTGMVLSVPVRGAQASLDLSRGDATMTIEIIDTVFNQALYAPVAAYLADGFTSATDAGTKRGVRVHGQPAFEEFTRESQTAAITVLVGKRFLVHVQTTGLPDLSAARGAAESIDMTGLAALK